jgi:bifunctional non-homologous end joining protein LigD
VFPDAIAPQLATLVSAAPMSGEWSYEIKYGYRLMTRLQNRLPRLITRGGHEDRPHGQPAQSSLQPASRHGMA